MLLGIRFFLSGRSLPNPLNWLSLIFSLCYDWHQDDIIGFSSVCEFMNFRFLGSWNLSNCLILSINFYLILDIQKDIRPCAQKRNGNSWLICSRAWDEIDFNIKEPLARFANLPLPPVHYCVVHAWTVWLFVLPPWLVSIV